jgi:hypothetical protein
VLRRHRQSARSCSSFIVAGQGDTFLELLFDFEGSRVGELIANAGARDFAGEFVEAESDFQALFASHLAIEFDLFLQGGFGGHEENLHEAAALVDCPGIPVDLQDRGILRKSPLLMSG